jgi:hypothetical protein
MGSIVKSIGKAIKKVAKGIKKVIKKIGPALIIAAAVYAGVAFYGSTLAGASGATLGPTNFMSGLKAIGTKVTSFFSPTGGAAAGQGATAAGQYGASIPGAAGIVPTFGETAAAQFAGGNVLGEFAMQTAVTPGSATAFMTNPALTNAYKQSIISSFTSSVAGGMTTGQALVYMTKMNMLATGVKMVAGFLDDSEEKQMQHDKDLLAMRYAYGKPMTDEQKAWKAENPNWISQHAAMQPQDLYSSPPMRTASAANTFGSQTMANLPSQTIPPSPYVQQQRIGQPTFGRGSTRQFETPASRAMVSKGPGLITKGTQRRFNPNQQRYS